MMAVVGGIAILARYVFHFIIEHENMVQDPSNNISISTARAKKTL